ncbi:CTTNBP2 N-terminal-like protein isoform X1 [Pangasianodon hypophthalmus]|uniref:CTTNBP2 N-terminal-like protein isoform X1 n=2 Tax=Pangasianodon hypophthalmus TaxID=310915 RepID=UPI000EFE1903|nr:CTTNBP2 N-terminal-like protein isoform X1 [Pangasianodon hypophthalmus]
MAPTTESRLNVDALSKKDVLLLFSVLEGELEARDLVIQALRAQRREMYVWERYGKYDLSDPFLALQRDNEALRSSAQGRGNGASCSQRRETDSRRSDPLTMLRLVVGHCRRMQEKMLKQLAAAESRHRRVIADLEEEKRRHAEDTAEGDDVTCILEKERERLLQQLEFEKSKFSRMEKENKRLQAQLEDERVQHKQLMAALGRECKRSSLRAHEEGQRASELSRRLERQRATNQSLRAELEEEKKRAMQMEARREELLAEFDTEREQLGLRLRREEACSSALQAEVERLRREVRQLRGEEDKEEHSSEFREVRNGSVEGGTEESDMIQLKINGHQSPVEEGGSGLRQRNENGEENGAFHSTLNPDHNELTNGKMSPANLNNESPSTCGTGSSPETRSSSSLQAAYQAGIQQRFHAARHKFQSVAEQDPQLGSPVPQAPRDFSPTATADPPAECNSKQAGRSTVTQALSRFSTKTPSTPNSSPFGTDYRALAPSGALSPGIRSPTIPRVDRGIPPPIPPKKPGLAETPPSPATLRAAHMAQILAGCGSKSTENSKEPDLLLSSSS